MGGWSGSRPSEMQSLGWVDWMELVWVGTMTRHKYEANSAGKTPTPRRRDPFRQSRPQTHLKCSVNCRPSISQHPPAPATPRSSNSHPPARHSAVAFERSKSSETGRPSNLEAGRSSLWEARSAYDADHSTPVVGFKKFVDLKGLGGWLRHSLQVHDSTSCRHTPPKVPCDPTHRLAGSTPTQAVDGRDVHVQHAPGGRRRVHDLAGGGSVGWLVGRLVGRLVHWLGWLVGQGGKGAWIILVSCIFRLSVKREKIKSPTRWRLDKSTENTQ